MVANYHVMVTGKHFSNQKPRSELIKHSDKSSFCQNITYGPRPPGGPQHLTEAYFDSTHNLRTGEYFGVDVISSKVSQTEL